MDRLTNVDAEKIQLVTTADDRFIPWLISVFTEEA